MIPLLIVANIVVIRAVTGDGSDGETNTSVSGRNGADVTTVAGFEMVQSDAYEYAEPRLDVSPTSEFTFPAHYDPAEMPGYDILYSRTQHAIGVFIDQGLTIEAPDAHVSYDEWAEEYVISANDSMDLGAYDMNMSSRVLLSPAGLWGFGDEYFVVEYLDQTKGAPLEKPLVTRFTVERDTPKPETASFSVDDQGVGHFTWAPVEGASEYYVIAVGGLFEVELVGRTTETTLSTIEQDQDVQDALADLKQDRYASGVVVQNGAFRQYEKSEDELRDFTALDLGDAEELFPVAFGVVAVVDGEPSSIRIAATGADTNVLPESVAFNAADEMQVWSRYVETFDQIPTHFPVTMSDGRTALRAVILDVDNITNGEVITADVDDAGNYSNRQTHVSIEVPYRIDGTLLGGTYRFINYDEATYLSEIQSIADRNLQARERTGLGESYDYIAQTWEMDEDAI
ncbi:MAG TPA: hypothetical protein VFE45_18080, partial [Coriobacteriia bacterium]|nr:hypothetical protein [Coriobacteriia bacterium]